MCRARRRWGRSMCRILHNLLFGWSGASPATHVPQSAPTTAYAVSLLGRDYMYRCAEQCPVANPSGADGAKGTFCPLRILFVQAQRVWNPQVLGSHERNDAVQISADFSSYQEDEPEA